MSFWGRDRPYRKNLNRSNGTGIVAKAATGNGGTIGAVKRYGSDSGIFRLQDVHESAYFSLYNFTTFTFKPIVARGYNLGPTLAQMQTAYAGQLFLSGFFTQGAFQGYQRWTVPANGLYEFDMGGAKGGAGNQDGGNSYSMPVAYGARQTIQLTLLAGHQLDIVVGSGGGTNGGAHGSENGGGGGTFVKNITTDDLLAATGGAGGAPSGSYGTACSRNISYGHGSIDENPSYQYCLYNPSVRSSGDGGTINALSQYAGGAGGGYNTSGQNGGTHCATAFGGGGFAQGMVGGTGNTCYTSDNKGGFGGGGGGQLGTPGAGGGFSGGYSSGQWSNYSTYGGAGGSYKIPSATRTYGATAGNQTSLGGYYGAGYCTITKL
jgi:hypothetical protein